MNRLTYATACLTGLLLAWPAAAQNNNHFTFNVGGGFTEPMKHTDGRLDMGYNFAVGAGVNFAPAVGLIAEFGYNNLGVASSVLSNVGAPDGSARIYSATLNPIIRLNPHGRADFYLIGGGGYYRRTVEFTEPSSRLITAFDPFYGIFFPAAVPTNNILGTYTQNKLGWNAGAGVSFQLKGDSNAKFYAESRYHYINTSPVSTSILPVTFGFRW